MEIGLSFGSNQDDRLRNLRAGRARVAALPGVRVVAASPVYETEPVDVAEEFRSQSFLNAILVVECDGALPPFYILSNYEWIWPDSLAPYMSGRIGRPGSETK